MDSYVLYAINEIPFGTLANTDIKCDYLFVQKNKDGEYFNNIMVEYKSAKDFTDSVSKGTLKRQMAEQKKAAATNYLFTEVLTKEVIKFGHVNGVQIYTGDEKDLIKFLQILEEINVPPPRAEYKTAATTNGYSLAITYLSSYFSASVAYKFLENYSIYDHYSKDLFSEFVDQGISKDKYDDLFKRVPTNEERVGEVLKMANAGKIKGLGAKYSSITLFEFLSKPDIDSYVKSISKKCDKRYKQTILTSYQNQTFAEEVVQAPVEVKQPTTVGRPSKVSKLTVQQALPLVGESNVVESIVVKKPRGRPPKVNRVVPLEEKPIQVVPLEENPIPVVPIQVVAPEEDSNNEDEDDDLDEVEANL